MLTDEHRYEIKGAVQYLNDSTNTFAKTEDGWRESFPDVADEMLEELYSIIDSCSQCNWMCETESMSVVNGELICNECIEENEHV